LVTKLIFDHKPEYPVLPGFMLCANEKIEFIVQAGGKSVKKYNFQKVRNVNISILLEFYLPLDLPVRFVV
jgi:hypothetical protein